MDIVDALVFALLAIADMVLLVQLRKYRARKACLQRMARALADAVRRDIAKPARHRVVRQAASRTAPGPENSQPAEAVPAQSVSAYATVQYTT